VTFRIHPCYTSTMTTLVEQVEQFRRYVVEQAQNDAKEASLEELFQRWCTSRSSANELEQSLHSLERGLADAEAGRLVDSSEAIDETRNRLQRTA